MINGNGKVSKSDLRMSRFLHKGKWHYCMDGQFVECEVLYSMRDMNISDNKIFKEFGKSYEECRVKWELDYEKEHRYPKINNWQKMLDYMLSVMKEDVAKFIKGKMSEDMKAVDIVPLLPEPFQPIFRLRLDYDEKIKVHKGKEVQKISEAIK